MLDRAPLTYGPGDHAASLQDEVQKRAFELFQERQAGLRSGNDADDWFAAEAEVLARHGRAHPHGNAATAPASDARTASWSRLAALKAADVMTVPVIAITADCPLPRAIAALRERGLSALPVVTAAGELVGVISQTDVVRASDEAWQTAGKFVEATRVLGESPTAAELAGGMLDEVAVQDTCSQGVVSCAPDASLSDVAKLMSDRRVHRVFVIDAGVLTGVVTALDLARTVASVVAG